MWLKGTKMGHGERNIKNHIYHMLGEKAMYGCSKHEAKQESRNAYLKENENLKGWNPAKAEGIYSLKTMHTYQDAGRSFAEWCKAQGITKPSRVDREVAGFYLRDRETQELSAWTISRDMAMLNKVWNLNLSKAQLGLKERKLKGVKRSRGGLDPKMESLYQKYKSQMDIARATGSRRQMITVLEFKDFVFKNGKPVAVKFNRDKGGKSRIAPILPEYQERVADILKNAKHEGPIFSYYSKNINNHYLRGDYAKKLADKLSESFRRTGKLEINGYDCSYLVKLSKKDMQIEGLRYGLDKEVSAAVSGALGHNRIDVLASYLYKN